MIDQVPLALVLYLYQLGGLNTDDFILLSFIKGANIGQTYRETVII